MPDALSEAVRLHRELLALEAAREDLLGRRREAIRGALVDYLAADVAAALGLSKGRLSQILTAQTDLVDPTQPPPMAADELAADEGRA